MTGPRVEARSIKQRERAEQLKIKQLIATDAIRQKQINDIVHALREQKERMTRQAMKGALSRRTDIRSGIDQRKQPVAWLNARCLSADEIEGILERVWGKKPTKGK